MSTPAASAVPVPAPPAVDRDTYRRLATRVKVLSWASLAYMTLEGAIAILAGVLAGSVALIGFGIDSAIEGFASAIIVWRFTGTRMFSEHAEQRAQKLVAIQFFILAPYVGVESIQALLQGERPDVSKLGIALSASSLVVMRTSASPSSASQTRSARQRRRAKGARTCCAPTSPAPC
jgi:divalent metal cation (Fe/Co/Zn/Cd) transporter